MSTDLRITFDLLSNMATKYGYIVDDAETCGRAAPTELDGGNAQTDILDLVGSQNTERGLLASPARTLQDNLRALIPAHVGTGAHKAGAFATRRHAPLTA